MELVGRCAARGDRDGGRRTRIEGFGLRLWIRWPGTVPEPARRSRRGRFDLSRPAIETARKAATRFGLSAEFTQMDAAALTYPDDFFDLVIGFGVLHHVIKYPTADVQLFRGMKPAARAVFHETLWDNPLINFARKFTSVPADAGDAPLTDRAIRQFCQDFRYVRMEKRHLLYTLKRLAKLPPTVWSEELKPRPWWRAINAVDQQLLRFGRLRRYCGELIVYLQK